MPVVFNALRELDTLLIEIRYRLFDVIAAKQDLGCPLGRILPLGQLHTETGCRSGEDVPKISDIRFFETEFVSDC